MRLRPLRWTFLLWVCGGVLLDAHGSSHPLASAAASHWEWEPFVIWPLAASAVLYAIGLRRLWARAGVGSGVARWQAACFAAGWLTMIVALDSPVAWLSEILFSVHMAQHTLLMLVAAPLLAFSQPLLVWAWALRPRSRTLAIRSVRRRPMLAAWHAMTSPLTVFLLQAAALWLWHIPSWYEAALRQPVLHAVQHLRFVLAASLFWWAMAYGRYGRRGYGLAVLYVFLTAIHSTVLGALRTTAPSVWYQVYGLPARQWHLDALADQQLAGLLMWIPAGVIFVVLGLALFAAWLGESERRAGYGTVDALVQRVREVHPHAR
jgi:cytochrome c oxidase assembly factor CtaG